MKIIIGNNVSEHEAKKITVSINDGRANEYDISFNQLGQLVINKQNYSDGDSTIIIMPSVSNEIRIS